MIIIKLQGGLGNQMFQYALGRYYQLNNPNLDIFYDLSYFFTGTNGNITKFECDIKHFNIKPIKSLNIKGIIAKYFYKYSGNYYKELNNLKFKKEILTKSKGFFNGYWQSSKYFETIKDILISEFQLKNNLWDNENLNYLNQIKSCNSISIHVRRGDYLNLNFQIKDPLDYILKSITYILNYTKDPKFFIFSNDIEWCKNNLNIKYETNFINTSTFAQSNKEILLMASCKHNIIANSTFSWWGAWLNQNPNKIVLAPKDWINGINIEIIEPSWIKV